MLSGGVGVVGGDCPRVMGRWEREWVEEGGEEGRNGHALDRRRDVHGVV